MASKELPIRRKRDKLAAIFRGSHVSTPSSSKIAPNQIVERPHSTNSLKVLDTPQTANDIVDHTKQISLSERLWSQALENLKKEDINAHKALELYFFETQEAFRNADQVATAITNKIHEKDMRRESFSFKIRGKNINVLKQIEKVVRFIGWSEEFITAIVANEPHAALAWAGVTLLLPLLLNHTEQHDSMVASIEYITDLMPLYKIREEMCFPQHADKAELEQRFVRLYTNILAFQGHVIGYLSRETATRLLRDLIKKESWKDWQSKIEENDKQCTAYIGVIDAKEQICCWQQLLVHLQKQNSLDVDILRTLEDIRYEQRQNGLEALRNDQKQQWLEQEISKLLQSFSTNYEEHKDVNPVRVPGTCEWFVEDGGVFQDWLAADTSSLLWVTADPGCGKSVLARYVLDEWLLNRNIPNSITSYFFFKEGLARRTHASDAVSAVLHKIFATTTELGIVKHALPAFENHGEMLKQMFNELWTILLNVAQDKLAGEVVVVLDALDECESASRRVFIDKLVEFYSKKDLSKWKLKIMVTSRPYPTITKLFDDLRGRVAFFHFSGDNESTAISRDIELVMNIRIPMIARSVDLSIQDEILEALGNFEHRTYLWVHLILDMIEQDIEEYSTKKRAAGITRCLPPSINEAYANILNRSSNRKRARLILQIIAVARRPLTLRELNTALEIAQQDKEHNCSSYKALDCMPDGAFWTNLKSVCGLFVTVHDNRVYLIHQTARDFLKRSTEADVLEWYHILEPQAHLVVSNICLTYLTFKDLSKTPNSGENPASAEKHLEKHALLDYAAIEWAAHFKSMDSDDQRTLVTKAMELLVPESEHFQKWFHVFTSAKRLAEQEWTALGVASLLGLEVIVQTLIDQGDDVNATMAGQSSINYAPFCTALIAAALRSHEGVVDMLIRAGADINEAGTYRNSALYRASDQGLVRTVKQLLGHGAAVDKRGRGGRTALMRASLKGYAEIVAMLLDRGADSNIRDTFGRTVWDEAIEEGNADVFRLLPLKNAADTAAMFSQASRKGHVHIVELLLSRGVDINARGGENGTALVAAVLSGYSSKRAVVELLVAHGADFHVHAGAFGNVLQAASYRDDVEVVEFLISHNADVNERGGQYGNALQAASFNGNRDVVELLLDKGAKVNARGGKYETALVAASIAGNEFVVELLLERGAQIDADGGVHGSALIAAATEGHKEVVKILVEGGADLNAQYGEGVTGLIAAAWGGHGAVVKLLLAQNVALDSWSRKFGTALHVARTSFHAEVIRLLVERGAVALPGDEEDSHSGSDQSSQAGESDVNDEDMLDPDDDEDMLDVDDEDMLDSDN